MEQNPNLIQNPYLVLWNKYATPPQEAMKGFSSGGFSGTDISPMWRIRCLTEEFGACGIGWYTEIAEHWSEIVAEKPMVFVTIKLYIKKDGEWSKPIMATGGNSFVRKVGGQASDEAYKMAYTDAIGGACKMLGIGGSVYWEKGYSKYEDDYTPDPAPKAPEESKAPAQKRRDPQPTASIPATPGESWEDVEWRNRVLQRIPKQKLDQSCINNWGTDFYSTPVSLIKTKLKI